jgi:hypothetical protein
VDQVSSGGKVKTFATVAAVMIPYYFMGAPQVKSDIIRVIQDLPDDTTVEDAMERLYFLAKIERGLEQSEGETIPHEEIKARFSK